MKFGSFLNEEKKSFTEDEARAIGNKLGVDWGKVNSTQFYMGINVELEHGTRSPETNVTDDDPEMTGKIALAHINEFPDYYTRLKKLEDEAKAALKEETSPAVKALVIQNQSLRKQMETTTDPAKKQDLRGKIAKNSVKLADIRKREINAATAKREEK